MASLPCVSSHVPSSGQLLASLPCGSGPMVSMLILLLSRFVHLNGFSPAWFLLCYFKWPVIGKILSYFEHLKGFSPVWVWSRGEYVEKLLSQFLHLHGFSPIWVLHVPQVARIEIILSYFEHPKCPMVSMLISLFHYLCT